MIPTNNGIQSTQPADDVQELSSKLKGITEKTGQLGNIKVTYIGGFLFRLEKAHQSLEKLTAELQKNPNNPKLKNDLENLKLEIATLEGKLTKVGTAIGTAAKVKTVGQEWQTITVRSENKERVYYVKVEQGHLSLASQKFLQRLSKKLAEGSFGQVFGDKKSGGHPVIAKKAYGEELNVAIADIHNEKAILDGIHSDGRISGIVNSPRAVITAKKDEDVRMIADKFDMDLESYSSKFTTAQRAPDLFKGFGNIFRAMRKVHDKGVYHGDIKPENIGFFRNSPDPLRLADGGGAIKLGEKPKKLPTATSTSYFMPYQIDEELTELSKIKNPSPTQIQKYKDLMVKADNFALAMSLTTSLLSLTEDDEELLFNIKEVGQGEDADYYP